jgi:Bor protein
MRSVPRSALLLAATLALAGCHTIRYDTGRPASPRHVEQTVHFFLWGLAGQPAHVDLDAACPEGAARWQSGATAGDWFLEVITLGIYAPRTVIIDCAEVAR